MGHLRVPFFFARTLFKSFALNKVRSWVKCSRVATLHGAIFKRGFHVQVPENSHQCLHHFQFPEYGESAPPA